MKVGYIGSSDISEFHIPALKNNGFNNAREIGLNKYNLTQVAYNSYISIDEANNELIKIRKTMDESAWILIKK